MPAPAERLARQATARLGRRAVLRIGAYLPALAPAALAAQTAEGALPLLSRLLAEAVEAELQRIEAALLTASASLEPVRGPSTGPAVIPLAQADRLLRATGAALGVRIVAFDARLAPIVDTDVPSGIALPASPAADAAADAIDASRTAFGLVALTAARPAAAVAVPLGGARPIGALVALLPGERLDALLAGALPGGLAGPLRSARVETTDPAPVLLAEFRTGEAAEAAGLQTLRRTLRRQPGWAVVVAAQAPAQAPPASSAEAPRERPSLAWMTGAAGVAGLLFGTLLTRRRRRATPPGPPDPGEQEARQALSELRAICDTIPVGLALLDAQGRVLSANKRLAAFAGLPEEALNGRHMSSVLPPLLAEAIEAAHLQVLRSGRPVLDAPVAVEASGALRHTRHLLVSCHPVRDATRRIEAVSAAVQDVTERTRAEAGRNLLVRELNHRVKNCLATVQTIANQTLRNAGGDLGEFARGFGERIRALSRAHDLLTVHAWGDAELLSVGRAALSPWLDDARLLIDPGPGVMLRPAQAQALVLAFNELATNAAKYGALTREEGRVRLRWHLDAEGFVHLSWTESGGPPVVEPTRRGFGTRLLEQALRHDLGSGASSDIAFEEAGLRAFIRFRPAGLLAERAAA
jgi:PAS domain S-box-containing protein